MLNERQRVIAQALLQRRLRNLLRVDDDLYFDTSLITHIEYQLFLDEQRSVGKFHQPDHWQSYDFPKGQAHLPVVGVRPSDAQAFCAWLTQHASDNVLAGWQFRLPKEDETKHHHMAFVGSANAYWVQRNNGFVVEPFGGSLSEEFGIRFNQNISFPFAIDSARSRALTLANALDLALDRSLDRSLSRDLARSLARDLARTFSGDHGHDLDLDRGRGHGRALNLDLALNLARDFARNLARYRSFVRSVLLLIAVLLKTRTSNEVLIFWMQVFDIYVDLVVLEERIVGNVPAFEGILLVKERNEDD